MVLSTTLFIAFLGGLVPALVWLAFWLFEDRCQPEPKRLIVMAFVAGMAVVPVALVIETFTCLWASGASCPEPPATVPLAILLGWAATEELCKFGAAYFTGLRSWAFDEPIDAVIYLVTAALGFSAAENALFLFDSLHGGTALNAILTGDLRFIGATLLHTLASAIIGVALALSFSKSRQWRVLYAIVGVILAVSLHTLFNFFILNASGSSALWAFLCIWVGIIAVLAAIERIKLPSRDYC